MRRTGGRGTFRGDRAPRGRRCGAERRARSIRFAHLCDSVEGRKRRHRMVEARIIKRTVRVFMGASFHRFHQTVSIRVGLRSRGISLSTPQTPHLLSGISSLPRDVPLRFQPLADLPRQYLQNQEQQIRRGRHPSVPPRARGNFRKMGQLPYRRPWTMKPASVVSGFRCRCRFIKGEDLPQGAASLAPMAPRLSLKRDIRQWKERHRGEEQQAAGSWQKTQSGERMARSAERQA